MWKNLFNRIFKKDKPETDVQAIKRFDTTVTPDQVAKVMSAVLTHKRINYNSKLHHQKKKSQNKNWAKWRV